MATEVSKEGRGLALYGIFRDAHGRLKIKSLLGRQVLEQDVMDRGLSGPRLEKTSASGLAKERGGRPVEAEEEDLCARGSAAGAIEGAEGRAGSGVVGDMAGHGRGGGVGRGGKNSRHVASVIPSIGQSARSSARLLCHHEVWPQDQRTCSHILAFPSSPAADGSLQRMAALLHRLQPAQARAQGAITPRPLLLRYSPFP